MPTTTTIDINPASYMGIIGAYTGCSWDVVLDAFENDGVTPRNLTGTYTIIIYRDAERKSKAFEKNITYSGSRIILGQMASENKLTAATFFFDVIRDINTESRYPAIRGTLKMEDGL